MEKIVHSHPSHIEDVMISSGKLKRKVQTTPMSYSDLWSGCEGGMVKVWPWESIEQSFSLKNDEINMASLLVEKSFIDLRAQVTVNGVCALSHADVHFVLADNSRGKVWSAGYQSFALWDARTRELVKVFNIDGQVSRADKPPARDPCVEDDTKTKISSSSKKDKSQNSLNFLQRSRNALLGAADVVRRVAGKGAFGDDHRTESMVLTGDGMIWTGCSNGLLVQWDGNGTRLRDFNHHPFSVKCLCAFGARMWVGYVTGTIQVLNLDESVLGEWISHNSPIIDMAVGAGYVFTLSNHGGIRGWNITSPGPLDDMLRSEVANKESLYTQVEKLNLMVGTWNVGQGKASHDSLIMWLSSAAEDASIIVVGLQEVEMGAGFLAISAARETVGIEGTSIGQWWLDTLGKNLDEGSTFERIGSRQLAGLLIALWVRKNLRPHIGDIDVAEGPCGLGHAIGNKGAVGLRIRVYDRVMCFVNCHLAAHLEAVNKRNADFNHIYRTMSFNKPNQINASSGTFLAKWIARGEINRSPLHLSVDEGLIVSALGTAARTYNHTLLDGSWAILRRSLRQRRPPLAESYLGRIFALASLGNLQRAFTALNEFESVYGQSTTTDAEELFSPFTSLSPLVVACTKQGFETLDKVYFKLEKLSKADPPYKSVAALNCIVLGCANIWDVDRAYQTFEAISGSFELTPDIHSYNALLCAFGKQNKIREATGVFNHLVGLNVKPNATTYSLLVDAHLVNRDPPAALSVIDDMVAAGLTPTKEILKKVRRRCVREFDEASDVRVIDIAEKFKLRLGGENRRNMLFDLNYGTTYS